VARKIASVDTLNTFLNDMRARYPDAASLPPESAKAAAPPDVPAAPAKPIGPGAKAMPDKAAPNAKPPKPQAGLKADPTPTGSIGPRALRTKTTAR
jgi:hypothetical protein